MSHFLNAAFRELRERQWYCGVDHTVSNNGAAGMHLVSYRSPVPPRSGRGWPFLASKSATTGEVGYTHGWAGEEEYPTSGPESDEALQVCRGCFFAVCQDRKSVV